MNLFSDKKISEHCTTELFLWSSLYIPVHLQFAFKYRAQLRFYSQSNIYIHARNRRFKRDETWWKVFGKRERVFDFDMVSLKIECL